MAKILRARNVTTWGEMIGTQVSWADDAAVACTGQQPWLRRGPGG